MVSHLAERGALPFGQESVAALAAELRGTLLRAGDPGYDEARRVWNGRITRRPALIAQCAGADDVIASVAFAREHGLPLSVRGGGHNVTGSAVADGGFMLDLTPMKRIAVDPERRSARVEPGLTWHEVGQATAPFGLTIPSGKISTNGVGGVTVGGGIGWLVRKHGLTIDHLLAVEIVTADGQLLRACADEHADLFWGVRGGGGNFGVVTAFTFQTVPVDQIYGGLVAYPLAQARDVLGFYAAFAADAPDELTTLAVLLTAPDGNKLVGIVACYAGALDDGERLLRPLRELAEPAMEQVGAMPYAAFADLLNDAAPAGLNRIWRSGFMEALTDDAIATLVAGYAAAPAPFSTVLIEHYGGAMNRVAPDATAFPHRAAVFNLALDAGWERAEDTALNTRWITDLWHAVQAHVTGATYVNFLDDEGPERVRAAYGRNYERLVALKRRYDPTNVFRLNQNIPPDADAPSPADGHQG